MVAAATTTLKDGISIATECDANMATDLFSTVL
jgi:hypothetical protein